MSFVKTDVLGAHNKIAGEGGSVETTRILMSTPDIGELEEEYVLSAMRSGWVAPLGPDVDRFEEEVAVRVGADHAVALSSGTAGLHLGLLGVGVKPGDLVVTASMTFAATANAITYTGATPVFVDCDLSTGNIDPNVLSEAVIDLMRLGKRPAAIVPVDLLGKTVDYTMVCRLAKELRIPVIADAAESLGATHKNIAAGSWGDASVFSFNGNKIMTTSGGGMITTDDGALAAKVRYLATQARQPASHYEHTEIGYNYRLSNLLAALGRAQLTRLDEMIAARRAHRNTYREAVSQFEGVEIFGGEDDSQDNCWLTAIIIDPKASHRTATELQDALNRADIESRPLWKPMHLQPVFKSHPSYLNGSSQYLFENGLTLPSGSNLSSRSIGRVVDVLDAFFAESLK